MYSRTDISVSEFRMCSQKVKVRIFEAFCICL